MIAILSMVSNVNVCLCTNMYILNKSVNALIQHQTYEIQLGMTLDWHIAINLGEIPFE